MNTPYTPSVVFTNHWFSRLISLFCLLCAGRAQAQVTCLPVFPHPADEVTITYDASQGNAALLGLSPIWIHAGVITNLSQNPNDWRHVATSWALNDAAAQMTNAGPNLWTKTLNIKTFFNIPVDETVLKLAFVFRDGAGNTVGRTMEGGDIFYPVYPADGPLQALIVQPSKAMVLADLGQYIQLVGAASAAADLQLFDNGVQMDASANAEGLVSALQVSSIGLHKVAFVASTATESDTSFFFYHAPSSIEIEEPPLTTTLGINYLSLQSVVLAVYAPNKQVVHVIGDFNDWQPVPESRMKRSADGNTWWIEIQGLPPGQPVRFQYLVDGNLRIADPLSTTVLDPFNDPFIPPFTPPLPPYPHGKTHGTVSVFQLNFPDFSWTANNYVRPKKTDLMIYELLLRDFLEQHDYPTLLDTLDYLEELGVTAIELMPVSEFDGNNSWGYNPAFHKALDKYYGTADDLKKVIDECHKRNIAVILDVVFNHVTDASPLAQLYWNEEKKRPSVKNPWLNPVATHDFNVFNDFNHESLATKAYVKNCLKYWLTTFKLDGFRFDLSKGFTQKNTVGNSAELAAYDASRVAIWKDYADFMWNIDATFYIILEHFADNSEEKELAEYGMMLWGNMYGPAKEIALGFINQNLNGISYLERNWTVPHLVGFMESHDEERIAYECKTYGKQSPNYDIRTLPVAMNRIAMLENLLFTVPGPKMLWQFGELGYDYPINYCENGSIQPDCRTAPKPIRWDNFNDPYRRRLHDVTAALLNLRKNYDVFETTNYNSIPLSSYPIKNSWLSSPDMDAFVVANVSTVYEEKYISLGQPGVWWYEYYTGDSIISNIIPYLFQLKAGEYHLYLNKKVALPPGLMLSSPVPLGAVDYFEMYPNPVQDVLQLQFSLNKTTDLQVKIVDLAGKTLENQHFTTLPIGEQHLQITCNRWLPGFYFLILTDSSGGVLTKKMVKL